MRELRYRPGATREQLNVDECVINDIGGGLASLVFCFRRTTDGKPERRALPVRPNSDAGGAAWGLHLSGPNTWQITPSIRAIDVVPNPDDPSKDIEITVWHETPAIVGVPEGEPWQMPQNGTVLHFEAGADADVNPLVIKLPNGSRLATTEDVERLRRAGLIENEHEPDEH